MLFLSPLFARFQKDSMGVPGFALLELAIALAVFGIMMSIGLSFLTLSMEKQRVKTTLDHQHNLIQSIANFVLHYDRLPCPADPTETESQLGLESFKNGTVCKRIKGLVPFRTLGLPKAMAKDGYQNWMTYAIDEGTNLSSQEILFPSFCWKKAHHRLFIIDEKGCSVMSPPPLEASSNCPFLHDWIAVILISHGPLGRGAYKEKHRIPCPPHALEAPNCRPDPCPGEASELRFVSYPLSPAFTHRLKWITRDQLFSFHASESCASLRATHWRKTHPPVPPPKS